MHPPAVAAGTAAAVVLLVAPTAAVQVAEVLLLASGPMPVAEMQKWKQPAEAAAGPLRWLQRQIHLPKGRQMAEEPAVHKRYRILL
jgi:hypothetical protein